MERKYPANSSEAEVGSNDSCRYLWPKTNSPRYEIGFSASAAFALASIACAWWIRILLKRENERIRSSGTSQNVNLYGY